MKKRGLMFLLMLMIASLAGCGQQAQEVPELLSPVGATIDTAAVYRGNLENVRVLEAVVAPRSHAACFTSDVLLGEMLVSPGDEVEAGDVLARPDASETQGAIAALDQEAASLAETAAYEAQMRDYEQRWTAGIKHKKAEQLFQEIREKTGEGKLFDRYTQYYSQSVKVEQCLSLADEGQKKTIQAYMQSYEENHAKFRELQEWKRSRPIDQIQQDQEYQRIAREQQKYKKKVEAGARQQNGVLFGDVLLAVAALAVTYLGSGYSGLWQGNERMLLPVVPFVFGTVLCQFIMRLLLYRSCESEHQNYGEFLVCVLISAAFSILPYLGYQYWLYRKIQPQGLEWTCIFSGLSVFAMVAAVILALLFVCVGQLIAGCVIVAIGVIAYQAIDGIEGMPFEAMARAVPELNEKLLFAAAVLVVLFFILYVRNKVAMQNYQKSTAPYERLEQEREHYMEDQLKPVLDYFRPYMDEKYLKELQIEDTEG